jgi:hypothetical protein
MRFKFLALPVLWLACKVRSRYADADLSAFTRGTKMRRKADPSYG